MAHLQTPVDHLQSEAGGREPWLLASSGAYGPYGAHAGGTCVNHWPPINRRAGTKVGLPAAP